jgi:hypothetical protein
MPTWILICSKCKTEFEHSQVVDAGMGSLLEPANPRLSQLATDAYVPSAAMVRPTYEPICSTEPDVYPSLMSVRSDA